MGFDLTSFRWDLFLIDLAILAIHVTVTLFFFWVPLRKQRTFWASVLTRYLASLFCSFFLIFMLLAGFDRFTGFVLPRILWTLATAALPLLLVIAMVRGRRWVLLLPVLFLLGFKFYGEAVEPFRLEVTRLTIPVKGLRAPVRIAHLSDPQADRIGPMFLQAREEANRFDPDLVFLTGDMTNYRSPNPGLVREMEAYLKGFRKGKGAFFVTGNFDLPIGTAALCDASGFIFQDRRTQTVVIRGQRVAVIGLGLADHKDRALLAALLTQTSRADARIVIAHLPDALTVCEGLPVDALFAGHTHGGQVCLPGWGPLITLSGAPRAIAGGGLHRVGGLWVVVSRGLGLEGHEAPRVRLFCRPQLILAELVPER